MSYMSHLRIAWASKKKGGKGRAACICFIAQPTQPPSLVRSGAKLPWSYYLGTCSLQNAISLALRLLCARPLHGYALVGVQTVPWCTYPSSNIPFRRITLPRQKSNHLWRGGGGWIPRWEQPSARNKRQPLAYLSHISLVWGHCFRKNKQK